MFMMIKGGWLTGLDGGAGHWERERREKEKGRRAGKKAKRLNS